MGEGGRRADSWRIVGAQPVITLVAPPSSNHSGLFFQEYIDAHPETIVLDPLPAIRTLLDRSKSYELIRKIEAYMKGMDTCVSAS